jgi:hypothetical protein
MAFLSLPSPSFSIFACLCFLLVCLFLAHFVGAALGGFTQTTPNSLSAPLNSSTPPCRPPSTTRFVFMPPIAFHWPYSLPTPASVSSKHAINLSSGCHHPPSVLLFFGFLFFLLLYFPIFFSLCCFFPYFIFLIVLLLIISLCFLVDP